MDRKRIALCTLMLCTVLALGATEERPVPTQNSATKERSVPRQKWAPVILGYRVCDHSKEASMDAVIKRFGKTYFEEGLGHSGGPIYRTSDGKAYLLFSWADCGLEQVMLTESLPQKYIKLPRSGVRRISLSSTEIKTGGGVALGDSQAQVKKLIGLPTSGERREDETTWRYVSKSYVSKREGRVYPVDELDLVFVKGKVVRMWARHNEL